MTAVLAAYDLASRLAAPLVIRRDADRLRLQGPFDPRLGERRGLPGLPRPEGQVIWCHAVSVGEAMSALPLTDYLAKRGAHVVLTTTSGSSAQIVADRLPQGVVHQFAPLDLPGPVARFLDHWRPDLALFIESEIWPRQIRALAARGTPMGLVNARLSPGSLARWARLPRTARRLFGAFDAIWAQSAPLADGLARLSGAAGKVHRSGNLKAAAPPLPVPPEAAAALHSRLQGRPLWVAASTHPGEDEMIFAAHRGLREAHPDALLILVPRHPDRAEAIAALAGDLALARRSTGALPGPDHAVYLADTFGETGLWFSLAQIVFLGGSLVPVGGHNPLEPARLGSTILTGPHTESAAETVQALDQAGALQQITAQGLAAAVAALWAAPERCATAAAAGRSYAETEAARCADVFAQIAALLPQEAP